MLADATTLQNSFGIPQSINHRVTMYPSDFTPRFVLKRKICIQMFVEAEFIIVKKWKQLKCLSAGVCINKMGYICIMECYLAIQRNEELICGTNMDECWKHYAKWKKLVRKDQIFCDSNIQNRQVHRDRKSITGCQRLEEFGGK